MITAQEFRIGNLFWDEDSTPCYFAGAWQRNDGWIYRDSANNTYKESQMYPIPLTTEILEKCGFKYFKDFDTVTKKHVSTCYIKTKKIQISFIYGMTIINANSKNSVEAQIILDYKIEYIHKLQNLYYALTQTELEIKL